MTLRGRIFVIVTAFILVVLVISGLLLWKNKKAAVPTVTVEIPIQNTTVPVETITQNSAQGAVQIEVNKVPAPSGDKTEIEKNGIQQLSRVFIERYQTFSNENNYENIKQVSSIVTPALWTKISAQMNKKPTGPYTGVTTNVFDVELKSWAGSVASVNVKTQRISDKNGVRATTQQNYSVGLIKDNGVWLVDSFASVQ